MEASSAELGISATARKSVETGRARNVIITVHGTGDACSEDEGPKWWQEGSAFSEQLLSEVEEKSGQRPLWIPFHWSGANSDSARMEGARALSELVRLLRRNRLGCSFVAHSHGGNVIQHSAKWFGPLFPFANLKINVVSFGAVLFDRKPKFVAAISILFNVMCVPALLAALLAGQAFIIDVPLLFAKFSAARFFDPDGLLFSVFYISFLGIFAASVFVAIVLAWRHGWKPVLSQLAYFVNRRDYNWVAFYSARDEVFSALTYANSERPEIVSAGSARKRIIRTGILLGIAGCIATLIAFWTFNASIINLFLLLSGDVATPYRGGASYAAILLSVGGLFLFPCVYGVFYYISKLLAHTPLSQVASGWWNGVILNSLRSAAFGEDSDYRLSGVRTRPIGWAASEVVLADKVLGSATPAAREEFALAIYESFERGVIDPKALMARLNAGLYHNAYFREPGIIPEVARALLGRSKSIDYAGRGG